jgi:hypothetical protein
LLVVDLTYASVNLEYSRTCANRDFESAVWEQHECFPARKSCNVDCFFDGFFSLPRSVQSCVTVEYALPNIPSPLLTVDQIGFVRVRVRALSNRNHNL